MIDFGEIYMEHFKDVNKYIFAICQDESVAEEITQETFFKAMQNIEKFKGTCKLNVWLCQIAKNTYFSYYKKHKYIMSDSDIDHCDTTFDIVANCIDKDDSWRLHLSLHQLAEPYKEIFMLRVFGKLSFQQIGTLFEKTDSWARVIFFRAKQQLREEIK